MAGYVLHCSSYITESAASITPIPPDSCSSTWYLIVKGQLLHLHVMLSHNSRHLTNLASYQLGIFSRAKPTFKQMLAYTHVPISLHRSMGSSEAVAPAVCSCITQQLHTKHEVTHETFTEVSDTDHESRPVLHELHDLQGLKAELRRPQLACYSVFIQRTATMRRYKN